MGTMLALEAIASGPISSLALTTTRKRPQLPPSAAGVAPMVIVRVRATALNPVDYKMLEEPYMASITKSWPHVFGCDMAGEVAASAEGSPFKPGDKVFGYTSLGEPHGGTLAEFCMAPADMLAPVPDTVSLEAASTIPVGGLTACLGLFVGCGLPCVASDGPLPSPILIYGASSSVGQYAVQLAKHAGARVVAVASARNHTMLSALGADAVVDYHDEGWHLAVAKDPANAGMSCAMDSMGTTETIRLCAESLCAAGAKGKGIVATTLPMPQPELEAATSIKVAPINLGTSYHDSNRPKCATYMKLLQAMLAGGKLKPNKVRILEGLKAAVGGFEDMKAGKVSGEKLVVRL